MIWLKNMFQLDSSGLANLMLFKISNISQSH